MKLSCGCAVEAGQPIDQDTLRKHYKHSIEALLFWELLHRRKPSSDLVPLIVAKEINLGEKRGDMLNAIATLFPEAADDKKGGKL